MKQSNSRDPSKMCHRGSHYRAFTLVELLVVVAIIGILASQLVLLSQSFRRRFLGWYRRIGKIQVVLVALFVPPSGLWMV